MRVQTVQRVQAVETAETVYTFEPLEPLSGFLGCAPGMARSALTGAVRLPVVVGL